MTSFNSSSAYRGSCCWSYAENASSLMSDLRAKQKTWALTRIIFPGWCACAHKKPSNMSAFVFQNKKSSHVCSKEVESAQMFPKDTGNVQFSWKVKLTFIGNFSVGSNVRVFQHLLHFVFLQSFTHRRHDLFKLVAINEAGFCLVEHLRNRKILREKHFWRLRSKKVSYHSVPSQILSYLLVFPHSQSLIRVQSCFTWREVVLMYYEHAELKAKDYRARTHVCIMTFLCYFSNVTWKRWGKTDVSFKHLGKILDNERSIKVKNRLVFLKNDRKQRLPHNSRWRLEPRRRWVRLSTSSAPSWSRRSRRSRPAVRLQLWDATVLRGRCLKHRRSVITGEAGSLSFLQKIQSQRFDTEVLEEKLKRCLEEAISRNYKNYIITFNSKVLSFAFAIFHVTLKSQWARRSESKLRGVGCGVSHRKLIVCVSWEANVTKAKSFDFKPRNLKINYFEIQIECSLWRSSLRWLRA